MDSFSHRTYSIYFSYAIFLADYIQISKIAGGVKQLTVPLLPDPTCSMPENDAQCVIPVQWICGYVHIYKIIKQLFHACSGNSQNYCPSVLEFTWELLPSAFGLRQQFLSHIQHLEQALNHCILFK